MKKIIFNPIGITLFLAFALFRSETKAEEFVIQIGDAVALNQPGPGAGLIDVSTNIDFYTFAGNEGQAIFVEEIQVASTFKGWLSWQLKTPDNITLFNSYLGGAHVGRIVLPETGNYTLKVWVGTSNAEYVGDYSFRIRAIPPDPSFAIKVGDTVSDGVPAQGAGNIEVPGAWDYYTFEGAAGQAVFLEEIQVDKSFEGWLFWNLKSPSGQEVFRSYFEGSHPGRKVLPETGTYTISVYAAANEVDYVGAYSFRVGAITTDQQFSLQVGETVTEGMPGPGAGLIEESGAKDIYQFNGTAGQSLFFDNISAAPAFAGWLKWEVKTPGGQTLFSAYFGQSKVGRKTLPETGSYSISVWSDNQNPSYIGAYSFRITEVESDGRFPIRIGDEVSSGSPVAGAGQISKAGEQDIYTFQGESGQPVIFERISAAPAFKGWLRWEIKTPSGVDLAKDYFVDGARTQRDLPETGLYTIRVYADGNDPQYVGDYAFRTWIEVAALPDSFAISPGQSLSIPKTKFLCNDLREPFDSLEVDLPESGSTQGGSLLLAADAVLYTAPANYQGIDTFSYRVRGRFGGSSVATAKVWVYEGADRHPMVVSCTRSNANLVQVCLLGAVGQTYAIEHSADFQTWTPAGTLTADDQGSMNYEYTPDPRENRFYRFRLPN